MISRKAPQSSLMILQGGLSLDDYAVIRLSRETTQEELKKAIELLQPMSWGELDDMVTERVNQTLDERIATTEEIEEMLKEI